MITTEFNTDAPALTKLVKPFLPPGLLMVFFFEPTLKVGIHAKGQYLKAKLALGAQDGGLVADLKDLLLDGFPLPAAQLEQYIPAGQYGPLTLSHWQGSLRLCVPGLSFRAAGVHDAVLTIIADAG